MAYVNILRNPDNITVQTNEEWLNLENCKSLTWENKGIELSLTRENKGLTIKVGSAKLPVKRVKLRWQENIESALKFLGDHWERGYGDLEWRGIVPERIMPWYSLSNGNGFTHGYGVKTDLIW